MSELKTAKMGPRFLAFMLDLLIVFIPATAFHAVFPVFGGILISFLYYPVFHASPLRATLGKRAFNLQVVDSLGGGLTLGMAILRQVFACGSLGLLAIGHWVAFFTERRQAVHDLVVDSVVVVGRNDKDKPWTAWAETIRAPFR